METLKRFYLGLPSALRGAVPGRLEAWARERLLPVIDGRGGSRGLEARLWGGFSRPARAELVALAAAGRPREAAAAALALARWHGAAGDFAEALAWAEAARARAPRLARARRQVLLEALFLSRLGRLDAARALLVPRRSDPSAALLLANTWNPALAAAAGDDAECLGLVNGVLRRFGLSEVALRDPAARLGLDNLRGTAPPARVDGPTVSVILPFRDAAGTLRTALASLAAQTYGRLEVLMVDDAGSDGAAAVAADFARADLRFRLLRQPENHGAYAARNRGLAEATGSFVTVHDADDWSHPEKIARQVADLTASSLPYNLSDWVRATDALLFWGPWQPSPNQAQPNLSSALFRREVFARIGPWDTARVAADRELLARAGRLIGPGPRASVLPGAPLSFGRSGTDSLTRAPATHAATARHGIRRDYREAAELWHAEIGGRGPETPPPFFPAPHAIRAARPPEPAHDLLFIADFNLRGGTFQSAMHMLRAARAADLSCAILHYRRHDLDVTRPLAPEVRRFAAANGIRILSPGEALAVRTVVLTHPPLLAQPMDRFPTVEHEDLVVVVNQMAERDLARRHVAYDPAAVRTNLRELLGSEGRWVPISARVRALMAADPRYPPAAAETWTPLIDVDLWCARPATWRGGSRPRPVVGRHGRDHPLKWPEDPAALRAAYCAGRPCSVQFLGGAGHARARLGRWPGNWRATPFDAEDVREFLAGLDVFVHFPAPDYIEEFGRAPMEAMAAGVPVILPPEFEPTFGAAALYAGPEGVWPIIERLWGDRGAWEARTTAGRDFVRAECSYDAFPGRLAADPAARRSLG